MYLAYFNPNLYLSLIKNLYVYVIVFLLITLLIYYFNYKINYTILINYFNSKINYFSKNKKYLEFEGYATNIKSGYLLLHFFNKNLIEGGEIYKSLFFSLIKMMFLMITLN